MGDSRVVLFSHPADFTPVCTTEIGRAASLSDEFGTRKTKRIVLSVDSIEDHHAWVKDVEDTQNTKIRLTMTYPAPVRRNFDEILRVIDALQVSDKYGIATPVDWQKGDKVVVKPSMSTEDARKKSGELEVQREYLRLEALKRSVERHRVNTRCLPFCSRRIDIRIPVPFRSRHHPPVSFARF